MNQSGIRLEMEDQLESLGSELSERWWDVLLAVRMEKMKEFGTQGWMGNKEGGERKENRNASYARGLSSRMDAGDVDVRKDGRGWES